MAKNQRKAEARLAARIKSYDAGHSGAQGCNCGGRAHKRPGSQQRH